MSTRAHALTFDRLLTLLVFLAIAVACALTPMQTDSWWQLRAGRDMWSSRRVLLTDIYSHTAYGTFWPNHEWLAEVVYYAMYMVGGLPLVTLFAAGLILGGWIISWRLGTGPIRERFLWTAAALLPASLWWEPRPHAFSLLFIPATVGLLATQRWWWLPLVFVAWANVHGGVLLGFVLLGVGLGVQTLIAPRMWPKAALVFAACMLAATATPLGLAFWTEIPKSLARIHLYPLDEWRRPLPTDMRTLTYWIVAAAFCYGLVRKRRALIQSPPRDATIYACAGVLLAMSLTAIRHVGPFLMIAAPALTTLLPVGRQPGTRARVERPSLNLAIASLAVAAIVGTVVWAYSRQIPRLRWTPVPAGARAALRDCPDNLYNRYDEGGYLLWFAPERKVFMDGRQDPFPPSLVLEHIEMEHGRMGYADVFSRHSIRCAYLPTVSPTAAALIKSGWTTLYKDSAWLVLRE